MQSDAAREEAVDHPRTENAHQVSRVGSLAALAFLVPLLGGCAALTNPIVDGVPARRLPPEVRERPKELEKTIPLTLLGQNKPDVYRLAAGDTLGIYIEGVLGERTVAPPVSIA